MQLIIWRRQLYSVITLICGVQGEARQKMYRFGEEYFPALDRDSYQWKAGSEEADFKGIQVCSLQFTALVQVHACIAHC